MDLEALPMMELLAVAMLVAIVARRFRLPYTIGLVVVGVGIALSRAAIGGALTHDFIFDIILPPLLFEAALSLHWKELRADAGLLIALSTLGTLMAAAVVALGMWLGLHWPLSAALIFGALISATDPVAVIAMFKDNGVSGRLRMLMESESLFNDAAAAILFSVALSFATNGSWPTPTALSLHLGYVVGGGAIIGALAGVAVLLVAGRTHEHTIETALTVLAAYGAFFVAERIGASGILATVVAGLMIGNWGVRGQGAAISDGGKSFVLEFWDFAAFMANSAVFPLIGVSIGVAAFSPTGVAALAAAIGLVLLGRAATIYPLSFLFSRSSQAVPFAHQHILWWGGLRGALALALALALPANLDHRQDIILTTFAVAAFSIIVQGLTMPWLLHRSGVVNRSRSKH